MAAGSGQANLKKLSPELNALPNGWIIKAEDTEHKRIYFQNIASGATTVHHPTLGPLPSPWILSIRTEPKEDRGPRYYNRQTGEVTKEDPRFDPEYLKSRRETGGSSVATRVASSVRKNEPGFMDKFQRAKIGTGNIREEYEVIHAIDPGDGTVGGMNGGIFVVRLKGQPQLYVEKRFKADIISFAKKEIEMLHRLKHGSLTFFCAAFIDEISDPKDASVYVEFCDRGSLEDLIKAYSTMRRKTYPKPEVPELFIWHAFVGLADGLAYLLGGRSFMDDEKNSKYLPVQNWKPILHRDIKPDNVLLRSRSTLGAPKYFYCVLSDFGLACEDDDDEKYQSIRCKLGTKNFWAPELCHNPFPRIQPPDRDGRCDAQFRTFPYPYKHSRRSDVWALGACIYNLSDCDPTLLNGRPWFGASSHITFDQKPTDVDVETYYEGRQSRKHLLRTKDTYSSELREAVLYATRSDPEQRPDAIGIVRRLRELMAKGRVSGSGPQEESDILPPWATKVHDYHSRVPPEEKMK